MAATNDPMLFSIGEVSAIVGLSRHTIRAWERRHQVQPRRTASGQRRYTAADVSLLMSVKQTVTRHRLSLKVAFGTVQGDLSVAAVHGAVAPGLWRVVADLLPDVMIVIVGVDGVINDANLTASETFGVPREDLVGRRLADLLERGNTGPPVRHLLQRAVAARAKFDHDVLAMSGVQHWSFDCRPLHCDGRAYLVVIAWPVAQGSV